MKKIITTFVIAFLVSSAFSQRHSQVIKWFSLGAKASFGNYIMLNPDILGEHEADLDFITPAYSFGGRFTFSYGQNHGFGVELMSSRFGQKYHIRTDNNAYDKTLNLSSLDFYIFYRYNSFGRGYFEIGPRFTGIKSVEEINSVETPFSYNNLAEKYNKSFAGAVLGFGFSPLKTDKVNINTGVRFFYGFGNMVYDQNYHVLNDGLFIPKNDLHSATHGISMQFVLEVNYFFAFWGNASCGRGRLMLFQ